MMETVFMRTTSPLKVSVFTFSGLTVLALRVTALPVVSCARAAGNTPRIATRAARIASLSFIFEGNLQGFEELDVLRSDFHFGAVGILVFEIVFIDANVQRFEEAAVLRGHALILRLTLGEADGGVELQNNVVTCSTNVVDGFGNPFRIGHGIVYGVPQFTK